MPRPTFKAGKITHYLYTTFGCIIATVQKISCHSSRGGDETHADMWAHGDSMRRALGFMGAGPLARSVCPVASNPVGDLVHAGFELL
jgi:hypothetical protein